MSVPVSTYRLQLREGFGFAEAEALADYLDDLGIAAVYTSPVLRAAQGSAHGYDLVDPSTVAPLLGGEAALVSWARALAARGIARVVDFVPNHVGVDSGENAWWNDVLARGQASPFARFFDIDWDPSRRPLRGKVLLPILATPYGEALEQGELRVEREGATYALRYRGRRLPLSRESLASLPADHDEALRLLNGRRGDGARFDALDALVQEQHYRLSDWRVASDEINYRRFFDVSGLAAVRMEDPAVFEAMHACVLRLVAAGHVDGLRLDHVDGLREPAAYLADLRRALVQARGASGPQPAYVVVEKILAPGERLPKAWPVHGTTGYDFLALVGGVWVDPAGERAMVDLAGTETGDQTPFDEVAWSARRLVLRTLLASEVGALVDEVERLAEAPRRTRDFTRRVLGHGVAALLAAMGVYRTYVRPDGGCEATDEAYLRAAGEAALRHDPDLDPGVVAFLLDVILLRGRDDVPPLLRETQVRFAMRFQQLASSVMAKGVEDTAFYRYVPLLALNEVGGRPDRFGTSLRELHAANVERRELWKGSMLATSTHDTKRAEDARARLAVLSEIPEVWRQRVAEWGVFAADHVTILGDRVAPTAADRYYFYQAVVGALPYEDHLRISDDFVARARAHVAKAVHEAKRDSSWIQPDEAYDGAVARFVEGMLRDPRMAASLRQLVHAIAAAGASNALGQAVLKLTCPGVADVYQGCELWSFDFCDPDNRRPVDFGLRRERLARLRESPVSPLFAAELLRRFEDGAIKMHVCRTLLHLRRRHPSLFLEGSYHPIDAGERVVAFARQGGGHRMVVACARGVMRLTSATDRWATGKVWGPAKLPVASGKLVDVLTGAPHVSYGELVLRDVLEALPVAVLLG